MVLGGQAVARRNAGNARHFSHVTAADASVDLFHGQLQAPYFVGSLGMKSLPFECVCERAAMLVFLRLRQPVVSTPSQGSFPTCLWLWEEG